MEFETAFIIAFRAFILILEFFYLFSLIIKKVEQKFTEWNISCCCNDCSKLRDNFLYKVAKHGYEEMVDFLSKEGSTGNASALFSNIYFMHLAAEHGHLFIIKRFAENGANLNRPAVNGRTPLHFAAVNNRVEIMQYMIDAGAAVDAQAETTPLQDAIKYGRMEGIKFLLDNGASINHKNKYLQTPLHRAAMRDDADIVKLLIERGAALNAKNIHGETPFKAAFKKGKARAVEALLNAGATFGVSMMRSKNFNLLHHAAASGHIELLDYLLRTKIIDVRYCNKNGFGLLHAAAKSGNGKMVSFLVERGADVNGETRFRKDTPMFLATKRCDTDVIDILAENGGVVTMKCLNLLPHDFFSHHEIREMLLIKYFILLNKDGVLHNGSIHEICHKSWVACVNERRKMQTFFFCDAKLSLLSLLQGVFNDLKLVRYLNHPIYRYHLENVCQYIETYPVYSSLRESVVRRISKGHLRIRCMEEGDKCSKKLSPLLPTEMIFTIFNYLSVSDMKNFITAFECHTSDEIHKADSSSALHSTRFT